ncbi:MAG: cupin domain-containing protein [Chitinophagaceae bacterium]
MKKFVVIFVVSLVLVLAGAGYSVAYKKKQVGYVIEREKQIALKQPGPHDGGGSTTASSFFSKVPTSKIVLTKRALHPGAAIGYHLQNSNEIYYILSGTGEMKMNGEIFPVQAGDAILTLPGSSHGLTQTGKEDLVLIINYERK